MNEIHYCRMVVKILHDKVTCKKTNDSRDKNVFKDLVIVVNKFSNCLLKEEQNFLAKFSFLTNNFFGSMKFFQETIQNIKQ